MMEAIQAVYPKSRLQRCIIHQIRSSTRFVSCKDIKQAVSLLCQKLGGQLGGFEYL